MGVSAKRNARIELTASSAGMDSGLADARRKMRTFQREQARGAKQQARDAARQQKADEKARAKALGGARSMAGSVASGFGAALGFGAAGGIAGIASDVIDYQRALTRLQITANSTPEAMAAFSDAVTKASNATGINKKDILGAASAYVALTGDMETAQRSTATWAKIAQATGTPIDDIASTAAAMSQQMGITSDQMESVFSGLAAQGKAGAVELKDLAGLMAQIAPQWAEFGNGKGARGVAELGAALQVVKRGFGGDAGETVTGLQSLLTALTKNAGRFEDGGIKIFNVDKTGKKTMKDVFSVVDAISKSKLVNDPEAMEKAFGRVEAYRAYLQLSKNRDVLMQLTGAAKDAGLIQRDFDTYMNSSAGKIDQAWTNAKNAVMAAFTPERIRLFSDALVEAVKLFGKIVGYIDKTAKFVGDVVHTVMGPTADERTDSSVKATLAANKDNFKDHPMTMEQKRSVGEAYAQQASNIYTGADQHGGMNEDDQVRFDALRKLGEIYRRQGDPWAGENVKSDTGTSVDDMIKGTSLTREDVQGMAMKDLAYEIKSALRDGFAGIAVKVGAEPIQQAGANSIQHRRAR